MDDNDKKALYRRIVVSVPEEVLLDRMTTYGYWPAGVDIPEDPADEALERTKIEKEIAQLQKSHAVAKDPDKALAEERKRRWEESKQRRKANKAKREADKQAKREAWDELRNTTIVYAGAGVSHELQQRQSDLDRLSQQKLPLMHNPEDVATFLGLSMGQLRWLTFHRRGATLVHYHRFDIPKKTGGRRLISAPKPALAAAQQKIFATILKPLSVEAEAHGFVIGHSIVSNASPHVGKQVVINVDLADFFPSITFRRVRGLFKKLGYSGSVATVLALLCTEPPRLATEHDGKMYHVALGDRVLPQGACTSPAITNLICRRLDRRLAGLANKHGFTYTRYADDLTFSGALPKATGRLLESVRAILADEGLEENPAKTRVMRRSRRQEVTGLSVNDKLSVSRKERRELRAILHNAAKTGLASQNRHDHPNFAAYLRGRVAFFRMVDPKRGAALEEALARALANP
jgi:retron-type reverse transcriptase